MRQASSLPGSYDQTTQLPMSVLAKVGQMKITRNDHVLAITISKAT